jgi:hypothetical protein
VKTIWLFALLALLLTIGYGKVVGGQDDADHFVALAEVAMGNSSEFPARLSEYVFLHQTRDESHPVHSMAGKKSCPE